MPYNRAVQSHNKNWPAHNWGRPAGYAGGILQMRREDAHTMRRARPGVEGLREMPGNAPAQTTAVDRITVALVPKAGDDLQRLQDRTGLSKTDLVNRAISLYEFIESQVQAGNDLLVRSKDKDSKEQIQIIRLL
jgi:hypothetical protein